MIIERGNKLGAWDIWGTISSVAQTVLPALPTLVQTAAQISVQKQQLAVQRADIATRQAEAAAATAQAQAIAESQKAQAQAQTMTAAAQGVTNYVPIIAAGAALYFLLSGKGKR